MQVLIDFGKFYIPTDKVGWDFFVKISPIGTDFLTLPLRQNDGV